MKTLNTGNDGDQINWECTTEVVKRLLTVFSQNVARTQSSHLEWINITNTEWSPVDNSNQAILQSAIPIITKLWEGTETLSNQDFDILDRALGSSELRDEFIVFIDKLMDHKMSGNQITTDQWESLEIYSPNPPSRVPWKGWIKKLQKKARGANGFDSWIRQKTEENNFKITWFGIFTKEWILLYDYDDRFNSNLSYWVTIGNGKVCYKLVFWTNTNHVLIIVAGDLSPSEMMLTGFIRIWTIVRINDLWIEQTNGWLSHRVLVEWRLDGNQYEWELDVSTWVITRKKLGFKVKIWVLM